MEYTLFSILIASVFFLNTCEGAKILAIFPIAGRSHFTFNNAVMKSLIDAGNEVTVITSIPKFASAENYSSVIAVPLTQKKFVGQAKFDDFISQNVFTFLSLSNLERPHCTNILNLPEIQRILNSDEKLYDVVFVEVLFFYKCYLPVAEKMKVPVIGTVSFKTWPFADHAIHNPHHPAYIPFELMAQAWSLDYLIGRIHNLWNSIAILWFEKFVLSKSIDQFHKDNVGQLGSLGKYMEMEPDLIFYNNNPSVLARPMNPNAIEVGGIHVKDFKPLPKNIQEFIDEAEHGVILFSLGSVVKASTLTVDVKTGLRDAFAEIPQRVIWKSEEEIENLSSNVMTLEWLPQRDILEHKKVIAFISHCGLGSMNEAIYTATPIVACPLFFDQPENAELVKGLGVAINVNILNNTKENVLKALNVIINDTRYYNKIQNLSKKFKDRPMTPQQSVVYWTNYVIRHNGASHLKSRASRLSYFQFLMLDVILSVTLLLVISLYLVNLIFRILVSYFKRITCLSVFNKPKNKKL